MSEILGSFNADELAAFLFFNSLITYYLNSNLIIKLLFKIYYFTILSLESDTEIVCCN